MSDVLAAIRNALDMEPGDELVISTPQFDRADEREPGEPPLTADAMDALKRADKDTLKELGLRKWSDDTGLWLFPHEWRPHIPDDYECVSINDEVVTRGEYPAVPDKRFGVLSFGIVPAFERDG